MPKLAQRSAAKEVVQSRILIVDDHPLISLAMREVIGGQKDLQVCGEARDENSAAKLIRETDPHLILLDLSLGGRGGLDLIGRIMAEDAARRVLVLSNHDESLYAERALRAGARGYVEKRQPSPVIVLAIRCVLGGKVYLSPAMSEKLLDRLASKNSIDDMPDPSKLSDRELETFELIGQGLSSREIAVRLTVSIKTIEAYRERIKEKLGLDGGSALVRRAVEWVLAQK
jgi:DNA-binding NarL/FixJ family response regulator